MRPPRIALSLVFLILAVAPATAQQARAPAGGMYVNGRFYKGGQFIPNGAGGGIGLFDGGGIGDSTYAPDPPAPRRKARLKARTAAKTEYRTTARASGDGGTSETDRDGPARSRLQMAKNLIKMGKDREAREWLEKAVEQKASSTTIQEARRLLAEIDRRIGPQKRTSILNGPAESAPRSSAAEPTAPAHATPRYFAQLDAPGPVRHGQIKGAIGVLESLDDPRPVGKAHESSSFDDGQAAWSLIVRGTAVPGRFVISNREFRPIGK